MKRIQRDTYKKIEIISTDDEKIKSLGVLFGSDTGKMILNMIFDQDLTASEIANKAGLSLELVRYHLQKMVEIGFVVISKIEKNSRNQDMIFYRAINFTIVILPPKLIHKAKESKSLLNSISDMYKFMAIAVVSIASWFTMFFAIDHKIEIKFPRVMQGFVSENLFWATTIALIVIISGLILIQIMKKYE